MRLPELELTRENAVYQRDAHNPSKQPDNPYDRCALCQYTRHPCDTFDLATDWLRLYDQIMAEPPTYDERDVS